MVLPLAYYGNPVLREKGARVEGVTEELASFVDDMFETMEEYRGIGLAAQQVGRALQLTVIDIRPVEDRPSTLELDGEEADPHSLMPLTLINPEITPLNDPVKGPEGCLSFPEMYGDISRPEKVRVTGMGRNEEALDFVCGGLLARCGRASEHYSERRQRRLVDLLPLGEDRRQRPVPPPAVHRARLADGFATQGGRPPV